MELRLNVAAIAEEVPVQMVLRISLGGEEREHEPGEGIFGQGALGPVSALFQVVNLLLEEKVVQTDFDLLRAEDPPGVRGELVDEEALVGVGGGEVGFEAGAQGEKILFILEGEHGDASGEAVLDGIHAGSLFAGRGTGSGGLHGVALIGGALRFGDGSCHDSRVTWRTKISRCGADGVSLLSLCL